MRRLLAASIACLLAALASSAEFIADIEYARAGDQPLLLDVSIPNGQGPFPIVILVHGGGWNSGDKRGADKPNSGADITPWFQPLSEAGFVWVSINYRLAPANRWPACRDDTLAALAWVKQNAPTYQGDPARVAVMGHSAGGHLALFTAFADPSIRPQAIVLCAAVTEFEQELPRRGGVSPALQDLFDLPPALDSHSLQILRQTSPVNLLQPGLPPLLLIHGDADKTVPIEQSHELLRRAKVLATPAELLVLPGAPHRLTEWDKHDPDWSPKLTSWLRQTLDRSPTPAPTFFTGHDSSLAILPTPDLLPTPSGRAENLLTQLGCNLSIAWRNRQLDELVVVSTKGEPINLHYSGKSITLAGPIGSRFTLDAALQITAQDKAFDAYVAADGSGQYTSVQQAIDSGPTERAPGQSWTIQIAPGTYRELIHVQQDRPSITLRGYDAASTVLTYDLQAKLPGPDGNPIGTSRTPSTFIDALDFQAENLTFENSAGTIAQALAIRLDGDRNTFRNCRFLGWQDTILVNKGRHYFENCYIEGHVDFIFGAATCYFNRCHIHCLKNGYITAASTPPESKYGYVFAHCRITGADPEVKTYLGRPWRDFAAVLFHATSMDSVVRPEGWHNWRKPERESSSRYAETASFGPGADLSQRAPWPQTTGPSLSSPPTPLEVLGGQDNWNPQSTFQ